MPATTTGRDRCSMAVGSRCVLLGVSRLGAVGRDRCSMAVGSRPGATEHAIAELLRVAIDARWLWDRDTPTHDEQHDGAGVAIDARWLWDRDTECDSSASLSAGSRSMLVGSRQQHRESWVRQGFLVAIDARWLWDRDHPRCRDRCSMAVGSRPVVEAPGRRAARGVAIDARWLWDRDLDGDLEQSLAASVAIDARWLWDRDSTSFTATTGECWVAIDARWLWDRDVQCPLSFPIACSTSRSMLDGCGIETVPISVTPLGIIASRSMLDGCGIETRESRAPRRGEPRVAIDARWLWDRDGVPGFHSGTRKRGRDRCSMAVGSRHPPTTSSRRAGRGRDRCSMAVGSRHSPREPAASRERGSRDRCSMAVGSRHESADDGERRLRVAIDARWLWDRDRGYC